MNFWQIVQKTAGFENYHWLAIGFVVIAFILFNLAPQERRRIRAATFLFVLSFLITLIATVLVTSGASMDGFGYRLTRWLALLLESVAIINLIGVLVFAIAFKLVRVTVPLILHDLILALAYIVTAITLLSRIGVDLAGLVATSAVITAVIAFSLQDTLGNILGGIALQLEHTISVGDWVRIDQQEGRVKEIRWRHTSIETRNWDTIVIPNISLMKGQFILLGRREGMPQQHRQWVYFNVDFRFAPTDVISVVETALCAEVIPNVAREPAPHCLITEFKDSYATYAARYWLTDLALTDPTDSVVRCRLYAALRRAEIPLSMPASAIFMTEDDETRRARKLSQDIESRVEALRAVELFSNLTEEEYHDLAVRMKNAPFVRGEAMTRQGATGHYLYLVIEGEADVIITVSDHTEKVATLHAGDYFGEMALMTGEPRRATVVAKTEVKCYRLDKEAFQYIIERRPEMAEDISHTLAKRSVELEAVQQGLIGEAMNRHIERRQNELLHRIRDFFGLEDD
jgi:small-conductance mechanosensitive channel/CRP-like cAMP-binding protein